MENKKEILSTDEAINIKELFFKFYRYWYLFAITVFLAMVIAILINKFSKPVYQASTTLLIQDEKKNSSIDASDVFQGFGLFSGQKTIENEIGILQSYSLIFKTIKNLNFHVSYYSTEKLITKELYKKESPFIIKYDSSHIQAIGIKYYIEVLSPSKYRLKAKKDDVFLFDYVNNKKIKQKIDFIEIDTICYFRDYIHLNYGKFKISLKQNITVENFKDKETFFVFNNLNNVTLNIKKAIQIKPINKKASLIKISIEGNNVEKIIDFLNTLSTNYLDRDLEKKNRIALSTLDFIDEQLAGLLDSLNYVETVLQNFRSANKIMNLTFQAQKIFEKMQEYEGEKAILIVKSKYYNYLKEYIEKNIDISNVLAPSTMGIEDPLLNSLIHELTALNAEKNGLLYNSNSKNPYVNSLNLKINNTKRVLFENINNIVNTSKIAINDINERLSGLVKEINKLPETERELLVIERKFKLNDAMYTYLLQKRSEAQIAKASNLSDSEVIDSARMEGDRPISPKKNVNYIIAMMLGCIIPIGYLVISDLLSDKIIEKKDIESLVDLPILGHIIRNATGSKLVVADYPKSPISESFRTIRTNLQFYGQGNKSQTILVTSSLTSEGKTFCSSNLAIVFALFGKKTLLMGFDLRKPRIFEDFELNNSKGISTYLIEKTSFEESIQKSKIENLDIIMSGPVPPNPAELIASLKTEELFKEAKEHYDYIIVDTSPLGLVTDPLLLTKYADANVFVVRQAHTLKKVFSSISSNFKKNNVKNLSVLINDVKVGDYFYEYGFRYGYYDESTDVNNESFIKKMFSKNNS